jgi:hypothetical protein
MRQLDDEREPLYGRLAALRHARCHACVLRPRCPTIFHRCPGRSARPDAPVISERYTISYLALP